MNSFASFEMFFLTCVAGFWGENWQAGKLGRENCARAEKRAGVHPNYCPLFIDFSSRLYFKHRA
jgi:hypothetical protein